MTNMAALSGPQIFVSGGITVFWLSTGSQLLNLVAEDENSSQGFGTRQNNFSTGDSSFGFQSSSGWEGVNLNCTYF